MSFIHEEDVQVAYEAAEHVLTGIVESETLVLVIDERKRGRIIQTVSRAIADAVIRSQLVEGDIADVPGIHVERVN